MTIAKNGTEDEAIFDCITHEAERQRLKYPEHAAAIDAAERKTRALVKDGKLEQNFMLVEFTRALERIWSPRISSRNHS